MRTALAFLSQGSNVPTSACGMGSTVPASACSKVEKYPQLLVARVQLYLQMPAARCKSTYMCLWQGFTVPTSTCNFTLRYLQQRVNCTRPPYSKGSSMPITTDPHMYPQQLIQLNCIISVSSDAYHLSDETIPCTSRPRSPLPLRHYTSLPLCRQHPHLPHPPLPPLWR